MTQGESARAAEDQRHARREYRRGPYAVPRTRLPPLPSQDASTAQRPRDAVF